MTTKLATFVVVAAVALVGCQRSRMDTRRTASSDRPRRASEISPRDRNVAGDSTSRERGGDSFGTMPTSSVNDALAMAQRAARAGRLDEAETAYKTVLERQPGHPTARHGLAVIADRRGDYPRAEEHYLTALRSRPDDPNLLNDIAYSYMLQNRLTDAERFLKQALSIDPDHTLAATNLGEMYAMQGDEQRALDMFRRVGTEEQARAQLARFTVRGHEPATAPPIEIVSREPSESVDMRGMTSEQLRELMDAARQRGVAARRQRNAEPAWPPSANFGPGEAPTGFAGRDPRADFGATPRAGIDSSPRITPGTLPRGSGANVAEPRAEAAPLWPPASDAPTGLRDVTTADGRFDARADSRVIPAGARSDVPAWPGDSRLPPGSLSPSMTTEPPGGNPFEPGPASTARGNTTGDAARRRAAALGMNSGPGVVMPIRTTNRMPTGSPVEHADFAPSAAQLSRGGAYGADWDRAMLQRERDQLGRLENALEQRLAAERRTAPPDTSHPGFPDGFGPEIRPADEWPGSLQR